MLLERAKKKPKMQMSPPKLSPLLLHYFNLFIDTALSTTFNRDITPKTSSSTCIELSV